MFFSWAIVIRHVPIVKAKRDLAVVGVAVHQVLAGKTATNCGHIASKRSLSQLSTFKNISYRPYSIEKDKNCRATDSPSEAIL